MDDPELIERFEIELQQLIARMHSGGLRYEAIKDIFEFITKNLSLPAHCENWIDNIPGTENFTFLQDNISSE